MRKQPTNQPTGESDFDVSKVFHHYYQLRRVVVDDEKSSQTVSMINAD
jgi:hypothetical protein